MHITLNSSVVFITTVFLDRMENSPYKQSMKNTTYRHPKNLCGWM